MEPALLNENFTYCSTNVLPDQIVLPSGTPTQQAIAALLVLRHAVQSQSALQVEFMPGVPMRSVMRLIALFERALPGVEVVS